MAVTQITYFTLHHNHTCTGSTYPPFMAYSFMNQEMNVVHSLNRQSYITPPSLNLPPSTMFIFPTHKMNIIISSYPLYYLIIMG